MSHSIQTILRVDIVRLKRETSAVCVFVILRQLDLHVYAPIQLHIHSKLTVKHYKQTAAKYLYQWPLYFPLTATSIINRVNLTRL